MNFSRFFPQQFFFNFFSNPTGERFLSASRGWRGAKRLPESRQGGDRMAPDKDSPPDIREKDEELADTLTAISVVAGNLAKRIRKTKTGEKTNEAND